MVGSCHALQCHEAVKCGFSFLARIWIMRHRVPKRLHSQVHARMFAVIVVVLNEAFARDPPG